MLFMRLSVQKIKNDEDLCEKCVYLCPGVCVSVDGHVVCEAGSTRNQRRPGFT